MAIAEISRLTSKLFNSRWTPLREASLSDPSLRSPGVYLLAYSIKDLDHEPVRDSDVLYVGMSNAQGGVRTRLKQFRDGIEKYGIHSGAMRFYREYQANLPFSKLKTRKRLYYTALSIDCVSDKERVSPADLRSLGHVCCLEYYAIARIRQKTGHTPPLNKFGKRPVVRQL